MPKIRVRSEIDALGVDSTGMPRRYGAERYVAVLGDEDAVERAFDGDGAGAGDADEDVVLRGVARGDGAAKDEAAARVDLDGAGAVVDVERAAGLEVEGAVERVDAGAGEDEARVRFDHAARVSAGEDGAHLRGLEVHGALVRREGDGPDEVLNGSEDAVLRACALDGGPREERCGSFGREVAVGDRVLGEGNVRLRPEILRFCGDAEAGPRRRLHARD